MVRVDEAKPGETWGASSFFLGFCVFVAPPDAMIFKGSCSTWGLALLLGLLVAGSTCQGETLLSNVCPLHALPVLVLLIARLALWMLQRVGTILHY